MIERSPTRISRLISKVILVRGDTAIDGQGLVEYSLVLLLVSVAVIGALSLLGAGLQNLYQAILDLLPF